jgi:hypothetical protein
LPIARRLGKPHFERRALLSPTINAPIIERNAAA